MTDPTILTAERDVRTAERAAAAPYLRYPPDPWWYPAAFGGWMAALVVAYGLLGDNVFAVVGAVAALILVEVAFLRWAAARHGALPFPGHGTAPAEIGALYKRYFAGCVAIFAVVLATFVLTTWVVAAVAAFVLVAAGYKLYERAYYRAADAVRARLA